MSNTDSPIENLKQEYLSQIKGIFPLHRAVLLAVGVLIVIGAKISEFKSVSEGLLNLKLRSIADFDQGFLSAITLQDGLLVILILVGGSLLHRLMRHILLTWIKKRLSLGAATQDMKEKSAHAKDGTIYTYLSFKKSESAASKWSKKIASLSSLGEMAATLFLMFCYAGYFGNILDIGVAIIFLFCAFFALFKSMIVFLRNYLPHAVHIQALLGMGDEIHLPSLGDHQ